MSVSEGLSSATFLTSMQVFNAVSLCPLFTPVLLPLWSLRGAGLERPGLCEQSLHGDALYPGECVKSIISDIILPRLFTDAAEAPGRR